MQSTKKRPAGVNGEAKISSLDGCESVNDRSESCEDAQADSHSELRPVGDGSAITGDPGAVDTSIVARSTAAIIHAAVVEELDRLDTVAAREMDPGELAERLLACINAGIAAENQRDKARNRPQIKRSFVQRLPFFALARIAVRLRTVARVQISTADLGMAADALAVYVDDEANDHFGTYSLDLEGLRSYVRAFCLDLTMREWEEVVATLRDLAPRRHRECDHDLIAVKNGIFDYSAKTLSNFDPERVFLAKSPVELKDRPENPVIEMSDGTMWDVESWMRSLSDDPEVVDLLWHVVGAVMRPHVSWDMAVFPYGTSGRNGKGTFMEMLRGMTQSVSIPLRDLGERFGLAPLAKNSVPSAILVDENPVGTFIDRADAMKALITGDAISVEQKGRDAVSMSWPGVMVQCLNELPRVRDKSPSFLRRLLLIPFDKNFSGEGVERRSIKHDYLHRPNVLEYVMWRVLVDMPNYYRLPYPAACSVLLDEFRMDNDPISEFWSEMRTEFVWDGLPFPFLFDLYVAWMGKVNPRREPGSRTKFTRRLKELVDGGDELWRTMGDAKLRSSGGLTRMSGAEPLIAEYGLEDWYNPKVRDTRSANPYVLSQPVLKESYRGLVRAQRTVGAIDPAKVAEAGAEAGVKPGDPVTADLSEMLVDDPSVTEVSP